MGKEVPVPRREELRKMLKQGGDLSFRIERALRIIEREYPKEYAESHIFPVVATMVETSRRHHQKAEEAHVIAALLREAYRKGKLDPRAIQQEFPIEHRDYLLLVQALSLPPVVMGRPPMERLGFYKEQLSHLQRFPLPLRILKLCDQLDLMEQIDEYEPEEREIELLATNQFFIPYARAIDEGLATKLEQAYRRHAAATGNLMRYQVLGVGRSYLDPHDPRSFYVDLEFVPLTPSIDERVSVRVLADQLDALIVDEETRAAYQAFLESGNPAERERLFDAFYGRFSSRVLHGIVDLAPATHGGLEYEVEAAEDGHVRMRPRKQNAFGFDQDVTLTLPQALAPGTRLAFRRLR